VSDTYTLADARSEIARWERRWSVERDRADTNQQEVERLTSLIAYWWYPQMSKVIPHPQHTDGHRYACGMSDLAISREMSRIRKGWTGSEWQHERLFELENEQAMRTRSYR